MSKVPPNKHIPLGLRLSDHVLAEAARKFGTPLYVYDSSMMEQSWNRLRGILPDNVVIYYSVKANPNLNIIDIFQRLGAFFEVASAGELVAVKRIGVPPSHVSFVGPGKSQYELKYAVANDGIIIVAESRREADDLEALSLMYGKKTRIALRINPGRGRGAIAMGGATQFGMEPEEAINLLTKVNDYAHLDFIGLHAYLGTGILDWKIVLKHTEMIFQVAEQLQRQSNLKFIFVDIGGGFGIPYYDGDEEPDWNALHVPLTKLIGEYLQAHPWTERIAVESGRFLIGPSGVFLTRVVDVKSSAGSWFVILDGGTNAFNYDNRYRGYRPTPIRVLGCEDTRVQPVTLCGPLCTSADRLAADTLLPLPKIGDLVVFYQAGAYGLTASPGLFLSHGFPCEVLTQEGQLSLIRERFTTEYILRNQPHWMD